MEIAVSSDCYTKSIEIDFEDLDCKLSDNFIDITSNAPRHLFAKTDYSAEKLQQSLVLRSVYDIG